MPEYDQADLAYWQQCQNRVTTFLNTNGIIEITLCYTFATVIAVLVVFGHSLTSKQDYIVFTAVIPIFSTVILTLAANVYEWIRMQLEYLSIVSIHPRRLRRIPTYEEWKAMCNTEWASRSLRHRVVHSTIHSLFFCLRIPVRANDIYQYYFLLYIATGFASLVFAVHEKRIHWSLCIIYLLVDIVFISAAIFQVTKLRSEAAMVRKKIVIPHHNP